MSEPIESLRNLGPQSGRWLREAGVDTADDLRRLGPVLVYQMVRRRQPRVSLNLLWAMAAALQGMDWRELADAEKERLRRELAELEG